MFAYSLSSNQLAPTFDKGDLLIISPESWARSGAIAAVEYGNETPIKAIVQVTYTDDFVVLESVNHKNAPIALVRGKDHFRIIGRVIACHQRLD
jgi:phage repressor protein C with HTH and peptisase S24 domain